MYKIGENSKIAVIGYGSWATALVKILSGAGVPTGWYIGRPDVLDHVARNGNNPRYLSDVHFNTVTVELSGDLDATVRDADIIVLAVPSAFLETTLEGLKTPLKDKFVLSAIKGIIPGEYVTVAEWLNHRFGLPYDNIGIVAGPCHSEEVALERLSYLTLVCKNIENATLLCRRFRTPYIHANPSTDIYGVEYAAVLKNIYAICAGMAVGLGYGDNFLSVLVSNAAIEMNRFLNESYPSPRDTSASAYLGDLLVTCYSQFSRNRMFGTMIGKGYSVTAATTGMNMIAEGYFASECIMQVNKRFGIDMPIAQCVHGILYGGKPAKREMREMAGKLL